MKQVYWGDNVYDFLFAFLYLLYSVGHEPVLHGPTDFPGRLALSKMKMEAKCLTVTSPTDVSFPFHISYAKHIDHMNQYLKQEHTTLSSLISNKNIRE